MFPPSVSAIQSKRTSRESALKGRLLSHSGQPLGGIQAAGTPVSLSAAQPPAAKSDPLDVEEIKRLELHPKI